MADREDQTEAPSVRRLEAARDEGRVALSRELQSLVGLGCAVLALAATAPGGALRFAGGMRRLMAGVGAMRVDGDGAAVLRALMLDGAWLALPPILAASVGVLAATLLQTGFMIRPAGLMPQPGRINPLAGLKRMFGGDAAIETLKALAKLAAFTLVMRQLPGGLWPSVAGSTTWTAVQLADHTCRLMLHAVLSVLAVQMVIAVLDLGWVRYRHLGRLRMSRQELREEHRQTDGDPHVKGRLRQLRRQRARRRMIDAVPAATVVITNPTHYAVALAYESGGKGAPRIVAKGVDELAARIRERAIDARVPLVSNPPLARALYTVPVDQEIPREHFQVVAGIIAYVWRLKRPAASGPPVR